MPPKVLFILGGGPRIGHSVARKFLQEGYKVAIGRRNLQEAAESTGLDGVVPVYLDVTKPESVEAAFREVESKLGVPNVVVYNAAAFTMPPDANDPFQVPTASFEQDLAVNASSAYAGLLHATRGFLSSKAKSTEDNDALPYVYIATGNVTPFQPNPVAVTLGSGKATLAYLISVGAQAYKAAGYRFYFASQVTATGGPVPYPDVSGEAHGDLFWKVVNREMGLNSWDLRFVVNSEGGVSDREERND
ncbi:uncharacterized protein B0I36DRAFT_254748 [Microdochium trichocladiopsis]|uniref:Short chain type dehydrogenase n=1 Tax=Microdochium trichocladiopsis TaxID=1682393 RepID=A0A9P8XUR7_9PEZI|nr:uncharacterized protein B0I36DRAFT_254748 [Microdochium trichocladiopsis]KAH7016017.1 hypothetical protein B0I36DRAFT_254748 [Microdochium trichocladiopsis]